MTIADYEAVYALWLATPGMGLNNLDDSRDGIARYLARNPDTCFVAEKDSEGAGTLHVPLIIGVILCGHDGRRGFINHVAVAQNRWRNGIGASLLNAALAALEREGIKKVALVVLKKNEIGNAFWERQGFTTRPDLVYRDKALADMTRMYT